MQFSLLTSIFRKILLGLYSKVSSLNLRMYAIEAYGTNFRVRSLQTFLNKHNLRQVYKPSVGPLIIYSSSWNVQDS